MAYQIYRIGEWERVGGVDGYSTIRAYLQPGLYETQAYVKRSPLASTSNRLSYSVDRFGRVPALQTAARERQGSTLTAVCGSETLDGFSLSGKHPLNRRGLAHRSEGRNGKFLKFVWQVLTVGAQDRPRLLVSS